MTDNDAAGRLPSLTGLRFVAAAMVFTCHIAVITTFIGGSAGSFIARTFPLAGPYGVGFFFVLSGFVLTWTARAGDRTTRFWRRRMVKIYPSHLVTFALAAVLGVVAGRATGLLDWVTNPLLLHSWVPSLSTSTSFNGVSWSLSCELFFYLAFPLLLPLVNRIPAGRLWWAVGALAALMAGAALTATFLVDDQPRLTIIASGTLSFTQIWFVYFLPPVRALEFVLGMVLARIVRAGRWPRIGLLPAAGIAVLGYGYVLSAPYLFATGGLASLWLVPLIAAGATADGRGRASVLRHPALVRLGELSFAFYLVHWMVVVAGAQVVGPERRFGPLGSALVVAALLGVALALAWALHEGVEMPLVRRFGRRRPHRSGPPAPPGSGVLRRPARDPAPISAMREVVDPRA
ncbi:acyltransferase family protein [Micromonospora humi]|uniref:Peptidoglycan/LPS O-acetylase OafA/YrhL, contains acyltransferase and SGNH-hydrolase domains n=1 Tax=Micromonospora humi TaxID=745366 RepID=A0A1C5I529_9ACTN|nr:acyltransferase [Micromonospora humi]SCG53398.1 Peptidoglycan/LPS O-acetylase OafA/YrhL, contains acyltransferase and SGNH-hydrolase domains [Micromonospora humi]